MVVLHTSLKFMLIFRPRLVNMGIIDAVEMGVPKEYIEGVMRGFIPDDCENEDIEGNRVEGNGGKRRSTEEKALKQAENFVDESSDEE